MKILQINTVYGVKSTGRTCLELQRFLKENGHDCVTAYGHGFKKSGEGYRINTRLEYFFHNVMSRIVGLEGYFSFFATFRLLRFIKKYAPDVIHLRNLHGHYLNFPLFFRYLRKSNIPVVVHLHDCWICTGGCTHPTAHQCDGWINSCKKCPAKREYPKSCFFDFSKKMFKDKKKWFGVLSNVRVVGVSKWVAHEGAKSYLKQFPVSYIYNWIDIGVFYPRISNAAEQYGIDKDKFNIICVSATWDNSDRYDKLLKLSELIDDEMHIVVVGKRKEQAQRDNITHIAFTESTSALAELYSCCDAYVHLSVADTFGKVIAEAMACGLPAVVYDSTACPEVVGKDCGFAVKKNEIADIYEALKTIREKGKGYYTEACVERVRSCFDYRTNCQRTLELYKEIIASSTNCK